MEKRYIRPNVDFLLTQKCSYCNYICPNCAQRKLESEHSYDEVVDAFLKLAKTLDNSWQITLAGGEPLSHPRFWEILEELKAIGLKVSIATNFASTFEEYKKMVDILGGYFSELIVEFHSQEVEDIDEFLEKINNFNNYKNENTHLRVTATLTEENAEKLKKLAEGLNNAGVTFQAQRLRVNNQLVDYSQETMVLLEEYRSKIPCNLDTYGSLCDSGHKFLVVDTDGCAYRCYCSRYVKGHILGNICDENFKLFKKAQPCQLKDCVCPKPIEYGMLDRDKQSNIKVVFQTLINLINIPRMVTKNADVSLKKYFT